MRAAPAGAARAAPWTFGAPADRRSAGLWPRAARCPSYAPAACRRPRRAAHCPATPALACSGLVDRLSGQGQDRGLGRGFRGRVGVSNWAARLSALLGFTTERRAQLARRTGEPDFAGLGVLLELSSRAESSICSSASCGLRVVPGSMLVLPSLEPRFTCTRQQRC